jgi:hypothetical protein
MIPRPNKGLLFILLLLLLRQSGFTANGRYRVMWRDDPATTMVIGWDQFSGSNPVLYFGTQNNDRNPSLYPSRRKPDRVHLSKGMNNHFVRLSDLQPNTVYYFVIQDSEGVSPCFSFQTMPDNSNARLSIIAGGDSRNHREARRSANKLVSKLRPHFILFAGDMTDNDSATEWQMWLDDWQRTIGSDGRLFPIVTALGNHELSTQSLIDVFDLHAPDAYYALHFGDNLLSVFTLNSKIPVAEQNLWLERNLQQSINTRWKMVQYHHTIRPHTQKKAPREDLMPWAQLFHQYNVQLALESDAHVVKWTYPIKPYSGPGSDRGFIRDDTYGTVYIGEGCWGAPLRDNNQIYSWTRSSGKFNQFKWIFVDRSKIEVRTVVTDGSDQVREVHHANIFEPPVGLSLWRPSAGVVLEIRNRIDRGSGNKVATKAPPVEVLKISASPQKEGVLLEWITKKEQKSVQFQIERSTGEADRFIKISSQPGGNTNGNSYQFFDPEPPSGTVRYRVKCMVPQKAPIILETSCEVVKKPASTISTPSSLNKIMPNTNGLLSFEYETPKTTSLYFMVVNPQNRNVVLNTDPIIRQAGTYIGKLDVSSLSRGEYLLIIRSPNNLIKRYEVIIR